MAHCGCPRVEIKEGDVVTRTDEVSLDILRSVFPIAVQISGPGSDVMSEARVDMVMSHSRVDILEPTGDEVVDHCHGPMLGGQCPGADRDGIVPCNGRRVAPLGAGPEYWLVWVPPATEQCPLAWNLAAVGY
jgi:hypothetical protein